MKFFRVLCKAPRQVCAEIKEPTSGPKIRFNLALLCVLCTSAVNCLSLDREAFSFTNYQLNLQVDPSQHRLGVRGRVTLRNDTSAPQKIAVLQISSSLDWRSIKAGDKAVQFVRQPYTSDIDHTGALSEAIVTFPQAVPPQGTIDLEIAYEGIIVLDATRLTRIGFPEDAATSTDWDQIGADFTALRGAGYVAWYPIATEVANLSEGNNLFEVLSRWKVREKESRMEIGVSYPALMDGALPPTMVCSGDGTNLVTGERTANLPGAKCSYDHVNLLTPEIAMADFKTVEHPSISMFYLPGHEASAEEYAATAEEVVPLISEWFGKPRRKVRLVGLPDPKGNPFESGALFVTPLTTKVAGLAAAHQLTHASFVSPRPWIEEGLAHFAQAVYLEQQKGRQAALDYMGSHREAFNDTERTANIPRSENETSQSLVNTNDEETYRGKAMCVWWMLKDMVGDSGLKKAIAAYRPEEDNDASYMPRLIAAQTQRDLGWFFDDWVYHDRGLPDFKVESAFSSKTTTSSFMVTITVDNLGSAGAEVPLRVKFAGGDVSKRLEVRAKDKATIRVEVPVAPQEIVVNDGSVPESDTANNVFKIESAGK